MLTPVVCPGSTHGGMARAFMESVRWVCLARFWLFDYGKPESTRMSPRRTRLHSHDPQVPARKIKWAALLPLGNWAFHRGKS